MTMHHFEDIPGLLNKLADHRKPDRRFALVDHGTTHTTPIFLTVATESEVEGNGGIFVAVHLVWVRGQLFGIRKMG